MHVGSGCKNVLRQTASTGQNKPSCLSFSNIIPENRFWKHSTMKLRSALWGPQTHSFIISTSHVSVFCLLSCLHMPTHAGNSGVVAGGVKSPFSWLQQRNNSVKWLCFGLLKRVFAICYSRDYNNGPGPFSSIWNLVVTRLWGIKSCIFCLLMKCWSQ